MRTRALGAKVNRDLCNNAVLQRVRARAHCPSPSCAKRGFYRLANNGGTRTVPNGRVTGRLCFSSIVINTCRAEALSVEFFSLPRLHPSSALHKYSVVVEYFGLPSEERAVTCEEAADTRGTYIRKPCHFEF